MNARRLGGALLTGFVIAIGCGDSDDNDGAGGAGGTGGAAADASVSTGGASTGGTSTGGASTGGAGGMAGAGAQPPQCTSDTDCTTPQICLNGGCVECTSDTNCTSPERCLNNVCVGCIDNTDCGTGEICLGGNCQQGCTITPDCPPGETCVAGACLGPECTSNTDCAPEQCVQGRCGTVVPAACQGHLYQCGDGIDNDGDGLTDMNDRDCLGPCSNSEGVYHNCIPGGGANACQADCYFDQDSGSGNDNCVWDHRCDPLEKAEGLMCPYTCKTNPGCDLSTQTVEQCVQACPTRVPSLGDSCAGRYAAQPAQCESFCGPLTPNGCDCFGCCDVSGIGDYRFMGSTSNDRRGDCEAATCTLDAALAKDDALCKPCTPVAACLNPCVREDCECCLVGCDLPAHCYDPPDAGTGGTGGSGGTGGTGGGTPCPKPLCPAGVQSCGLDCLPPCPSGFYCSTGCCRPIPA